MELFLHAQELGGLLLGEPVDGDPRPGGQHLGDDLLVDDVEGVHALGAQLGLLALLAVEALLLLLGQLLGLLEGALLNGGLLVGPQARDLLVELLRARRDAHAPDAQAAAGLVDEVDRLVREVPVGQVAVGQVGRGNQRLVGDADGVVRLVAVAQALEDVDGERHRGLVHLDGLEAPLQGGVLLEVLAVLVDRRGADGLQLAAGQHRLEDGGGVDGPLGGARADQRVDLVDEEDDVAPSADLLEDLLQPLLEVAAVAAARHERAEVQRVELLARQRLGHFVGDDLLGQPLDDGGLADAGLTDQDGVVLGPARQHLHDAFDLFCTSDDRVELAVPGELGEVAPELVEHRGARRAVARAGALARADRLLALVARHELDDLLAHPSEVGPEADEDGGRHTLALADETEEHVLGADVAVAELQRLTERELEDLLGPRGERRGPAGRGPGHADRLFDLLANGFEGDPQGLERLGGDPLALVDQPEEDVLGSDEAVVEQARFLLRQHQHPPCPVGETFEHPDRLSLFPLASRSSVPVALVHHAATPGTGHLGRKPLYGRFPAHPPPGGCRISVAVP